MKKVVAYISIILSFLAATITVYDFAIGNISNYLAPKEKLQTIIEKQNRKYKEDVYVRKDLRLFLDISPGVLQSRIFNYPLGEYKLTRCQDFQNVLRNLSVSIKKFQNSYYGIGAVNIELKGFADGYPVLPNASYIGDLGIIKNFKHISSNSEHKYLTIRPGDRLTNEYIEFLRAYDVLRYLEGVGLVKSTSEVQVSTHTTNVKGGEYRKMELLIIIPEILKIDDITPVTRVLMDVVGYSSEFYIRKALPEIKNRIDMLSGQSETQ